jgi:hypothetical protein
MIKILSIALIVLASVATSPWLGRKIARRLNTSVDKITSLP